MKRIILFTPSLAFIHRNKEALLKAFPDAKICFCQTWEELNHEIPGFTRQHGTPALVKSGELNETVIVADWNFRDVVGLAQFNYIGGVVIIRTQVEEPPSWLMAAYRNFYFRHGGALPTQISYQLGIGMDAVKPVEYDWKTIYERLVRPHGFCPDPANQD